MLMYLLMLALGIALTIAIKSRARARRRGNGWFGWSLAFVIFGMLTSVVGSVMYGFLVVFGPLLLALVLFIAPPGPEPTPVKSVDPRWAALRSTPMPKA